MIPRVDPAMTTDVLSIPLYDRADCSGMGRVILFQRCIGMDSKQLWPRY